MIIRTSMDLGAVIRERRKELKLDQAALANRIGTSRQWLSGVEGGRRARAEIGLVLRALDALGLRLDTSIAKTMHRDAPDLDAIVAAARKRDK